MATLEATATRHRYTDKSVEIHLSRPHVEDKKGWGSGSKKALNYGKQGRQTANKNIA